jgi:membrane protein
LRLDPLQLEPVLEILVGLNWIGRINEIEDEERTRYLLLADPESTALEPLLRNLLLADSDATATLWKASRLADVALKDVV